VIAANSFRNSSRVFSSMSVRISSKKLARVVRLVARGLAGRDAAQLALVGERLEFLVGRAQAASACSLTQLTDRGSRSVSATARIRSRALIDSVHDWTPSREDSDMLGTS